MQYSQGAHVLVLSECLVDGVVVLPAVERQKVKRKTRPLKKLNLARPCIFSATNQNKTSSFIKCTTTVSNSLSCFQLLKLQSERPVIELLIRNCHTFCSACKMMDYIHQCEASNQIYRTPTPPRRRGCWSRITNHVIVLLSTLMMQSSLENCTS